MFKGVGERGSILGCKLSEGRGKGGGFVMATQNKFEEVGVFKFVLRSEVDAQVCEGY